MNGLLGSIFGKPVTQEYLEDQRQAMQNASATTNAIYAQMNANALAARYPYASTVSSSIHSQPSRLLINGRTVMSEGMRKADILTTGAHPAMKGELVDTLLKMADSDDPAERYYAVVHSDLPEAKRVFMQNDQDEAVRLAALTILEWSE